MTPTSHAGGVLLVGAPIQRSNIREEGSPLDPLSESQV